MKIVQNLSIRNKIITLVLLVSILSLMIGFTIVTLITIRTMTGNLSNASRMNARMVSDYSASPLLFHDSEGLTDILSKLESIPSINKVCIFDIKGKLFAQYHFKENETQPEFAPGQDTIVFKKSSLEIIQPIVYHGERYGTIYMQVSTRELDQAISKYLVTMAFLTAGLFVFTFLFAWILQKWISKPILHLARVTQEIAVGADHSIRVTKEGNDEIGVLYDGFNYMMEQLQSRARERDTAHAHLLESEANLRKAQEIAHVGNWSWNTKTDQIECSDEIYRIIGIEKGSFSGSLDEAMKRFVHPGDHDLVKKVLVSMNDKPLSFEFRVLWPDQTIHQIWVKAEKFIPDEKSQSYLLTGIAQDITERKQAEEALQRHAQRLRNLHQVDQAILLAIETPEAIARIALQHLGALLRCQRASVGTFDHQMKKISIFASETDDKTMIQSEKELSKDAFGNLEMLQQGKIDIVEDISKLTFPGMAGDLKGIGSYINVPLMSVNQLIGALNLSWKNPRSFLPEELEIAHEVAGQIAIAIEQARLRHETEQHAIELEHRVQMRTDELQASNKELEAFAYSVSHDLRAPLRGIDGFTKILMDEYGSSFDEEGHRLFAAIRDNSQRMGQLIDDLLSFSRTNRAEIKRTNVDIKNLVYAIYPDLATPAMRERIILEIGDMEKAYGDPTMIKQVWVNLLSNAIKFSSKKKKALITISCKKEERRVIYQIQDNGAGFDMRYKDKLFGVFQRLHSSKDYEGTGVGLALVERIIRRHGGEVWATGEVDKGATFSFSLPLYVGGEG
jgi:PAS domain S-box-containing protein